MNDKNENKKPCEECKNDNSESIADVVKNEVCPEKKNN